MNLAQRTSLNPLLFVIGTAEIGGAEKQLVRLAKELKSHGISIEVAFTQAGGPLTAELDKAGIPWKKYAIRPHRRPWTSIGGVIRLCWYLVTERPVLINTWLDESAMIALPLARIFSPKTRRVASVRGYIPRESRILKLIFTKVLKTADRVLFNSSHLAKIAEDKFQVRREQMEVIPNAVELPTKLSDVKHQPPTAVVVANFHGYKGYNLLIEALAEVSAPLKIRFCGTGPERDLIAEMIAQRNLGSMIDLVPEPADINYEIGSAQFAVHPSTTEGMSNAILEEMASGLPVIAFDIEGNAPLITNNVNGILVKDLDVKALAQAVDLLASNADMRIQLSAGARKKVEDFSWASCTSRYEKTFTDIIESPRSKH